MSYICMKHCSYLLQRSADSLNLLWSLANPDEGARHEAILNIQRVLESWYFGFGSPAVTGFLENVVEDTGGATMDTSMHGLIREQIPDLLRISHTSLSSDVRTAAREMLLDLKSKKGFKIPRIATYSPSFIIPAEEMEHLKCIYDEPSEGDAHYTTYVLFREYWFHWGRLSNYITVMGYHPEYLEPFMKLQEHLFHGDLPLPYPDRYYLAVIAAAQERCVYLVLLFARQFISSGGNVAWLQGIQYGPSKWRQLCSLSLDLSRSPWKITSNYIYDLTHGGDMSLPKETISLSELMHSVTILTHVHALCCFIFACGIRPEIDQYDGLFDCDEINHHFNNGNENNNLTTGTIASSNNNGTNDNVTTASTNINTNIMDNGTVNQFMNPENCNCIVQLGDDRVCSHDGLGVGLNYVSDKFNQNLSPHSLLTVIQTEDSYWEEVAEDIVAEQFMLTVRYNAELENQILQSNRQNIKSIQMLYEHSIITRFLESPHSDYKNFNGRPFHISEYSWQEEGVALADRLCTDLGTLLDEKYRNIYDLTYNTLNDITNVDTSLYRQAVWNQVQSFFGICHDDFRYDRVDRLLTPTQRCCLKLCATFPSLIIGLRDFNYETIFPALSISEVVHVILMVVEARQQSCLLYILRAISECQARTK